MADALGAAHLEGLVDAGQPVRLPGVDGEGHVLATQVLEGVEVVGGREAVLGPGDVEADDPASRKATARSAASRTRSNIRMPQSRVPTRTGVPAAAALAMPVARPSWTVSTTSLIDSPPLVFSSGA